MSRFSNLFEAILVDDRLVARAALKQDPTLVTQTADADKFHDSIAHYTYRGDTALHLAAAAYRHEIAKLLLTAGASPTAPNRRNAQPLHYASDGHFESPNWSPAKQVRTIDLLLSAGALIDAQDANGASPLHRAVRTRCAAAVACLLEHEASAALKNRSGSTPFHLAVQNTGRGGSGSPEAKAAQLKIVELFLRQGVSAKLKDASGKTVVQWAKEPAIQSLLAGDRA